MTRTCGYVAGLLFAASLLARPVYVSPVGCGPGTGTKDRPFSTIEEALASGEKEIVLLSGLHCRTNTLVLAAAEAGRVIRAETSGTALLSMGVQVPDDAWQRVDAGSRQARLPRSAQGKVFLLDLKALGMTHAQTYPDVFGDFGGICQLIVAGTWMPLSRYPNSAYLKIDAILDKGDLKSGPKTKGGVFRTRNTHLGRWSVDDGVWVQGFWVVPWVRTAVRVGVIDRKEGIVTLATGMSRGIGSKYAKPPALGNGMETWRVINAFEELDEPGEWCIDFKEQKLYFFSPDGKRPTHAMILDRRDAVVNISRTKEIVLEGLVVEGSLGDGIVASASEGIAIRGCTVRSLGGNGIVMTEAVRNCVQSCDVVDIGHSGVVLQGGDRKRLIASECSVDNSRFTRIGLHQNTYAPPIDCKAGVGYRITHNFIHDVPHAGVLYFNNNDSLFEYNEIARAALDSGDVGAFYSCLDRTSRGNILRYNWVYDAPHINGFYVDDGDSGDRIVHNICYNTAYGPFVGGGHDNWVAGNLSIACVNAGFHIDSRGLSRGYKDHPGMSRKLAEYQVTQLPWSIRYPELARMDPSLWGYPTGNVLTNNLAVGCKQPLRKSGKTEDLKYSHVSEPVVIATLEEAGFRDPLALDFRPRPDAEILKIWPAIRSIPFERIGLYRDTWRTVLPDRLQLKKEAERVKSRKDVFDSEDDLRASGL